MLQTPKPVPPSAPATIADAVAVLQSEGWKNLGYFAISRSHTSYLFIRRRDPANPHEKPAEFWLSSRTLVDVLRLPTLAEFQQGAPMPATGQPNG
jgi:hypothetical protein